MPPSRCAPASRRLGEVEGVEQLVGPHPGRLPRVAEEARDEHEVLAAGEILVHRRELAGEAHLLPDLAGLLDHVEAEDAGGAAVGAEERAQHADRRGLAGTVRAEEADRRPRSTRRSSRRRRVVPKCLTRAEVDWRAHGVGGGTRGPRGPRKSSVVRRVAPRGRAPSLRGVPCSISGRASSAPAAPRPLGCARTLSSRDRPPGRRGRGRAPERALSHSTARACPYLGPDGGPQQRGGARRRSRPRTASSVARTRDARGMGLAQRTQLERMPAARRHRSILDGASCRPCSSYTSPARPEGGARPGEQVIGSCRDAAILHGWRSYCPADMSPYERPRCGR